MTLIRSIREGLSRAGRAPALLLLLWAVNLAVAVPFAAVLAGSIHDSVDGRPVQSDLAAGWEPTWFGELEAQARGFERTFGPAVTGAGAFLRNLEGWWSGRALTPEFGGGWGLLAAGVGYALLWALLLGGVIDHLAGSSPEPDPGRTVRRLDLGRFLGVGGRTFFRFVRLAVLSGVLYLLIYLGARRMFGWMEEAARNVTVERTVLIRVALGAALVVLLLTVVRVVFEYAKIAVVVEDRRSVLGAAWTGLRFVAAHPVRTLGLFWSFAGAGLVLLWLYGLLAPGPGSGPWTGSWAGVILVLLLGQLALAARLFLRLAVLGGEVGLYRSGTAGERRSGRSPGEPPP
ncbi:MAG: hypothetical protein PVG07_02155 [Acidobacteriota bacterium]|jgi:hypothetical protein